MGALIRAFDWSQTPLGPVASWPRELRFTLGLVLDNAFGMYIAWGQDFTQIYNDGYRPILGSSKHPSALGAGTLETFKEIWPTIGPLFAQVMAGQAVGFEDLLLQLDRNGYLEDCYFTFSYSPIRLDSGEVGGVLVTVTETTSRVRADKQSLRAQTELDLARKELENIFQQAPFPMAILTGPENRFTLANGPYVKFVGREVLGKPLVGAFTAAEASYYVEVINRVRETSEPVIIREALLSLTEPDGTVRELFIDVGYHPYFDGAGKVQGVMAVIHDATASVRARQSVEQLAKDLQAAVVTRDEFLSIASHELRTPITALMLEAQMLARRLGRGEASPERTEKFVAGTQRQLARLTRLVDDMLDISRIARGSLQVNPEPVDLSALAADVGARFQDQLAAAGCTLSVDAPAPVAGTWDRYRLEQVVVNLITNAIKYAPGAPFALAVRRASPGLAELRATDGGPGVAPENQERIFHRFERVSSTARSSGLGLGLYICREIVEAHGGTIRMESAPGKGSTFIVSLPLHAPVAAR
jgi:signal transduction histidine kinase